MSMPDEEAYDAALHMIKYVFEQKDRGIRFNSKGNWDLLTAYDASNKPDWGDSKASAGYVVYLAGGPVSWSSKKARHAGTSSSHNEYMAVFHAATETKWIRDLLIEIDRRRRLRTRPGTLAIPRQRQGGLGCDGSICSTSDHQSAPTSP